MHAFAVVLLFVVLAVVVGAAMCCSGALFVRAWRLHVEPLLEESCMQVLEWLGVALTLVLVIWAGWRGLLG